ncbi:hypothetical protein [Rhizobium sp.]
MDGKTGRPIISLKFKAPAPEADKPATKSAEITRKPQVSGREPFVVPKAPSRKQGVREVVVARPQPATVKAPAPVEKAPVEAKPVPIPPAAFKAATKAATQAVSSVLADPGWQSAELQKSYQEAKLHALPLHRKQAKLISGIVLKRVAPDLDEGETKTLAMRAAYAAAFSTLIGETGEQGA